MLSCSIRYYTYMFHSPSGSINKPFRALLFDSWYDQYVGVVCLVRVVDGKIRKGMCSCIHSHHLLTRVYTGDKIAFVHSDSKYDVSEVKSASFESDQSFNLSQTRLESCILNNFPLDTCKCICYIATMTILLPFD